MNRTKQVKKLRNIFAITSAGTWVCTAIFLVLWALTHLVGDVDPSVQIILSEELKNVVLSISITTVIGITAAIVIKEKLRTAIWMACTIMAAIMFKEVGMFVVLGLWFIDEYVLYSLYKYYKNAVQINKEIDLRG